MSKSRGGGCALLIVGFVLGWLFAIATRPVVYVETPAVTQEAPVAVARRESAAAAPAAIIAEAPVIDPALELDTELESAIAAKESSDEFTSQDVADTTPQAALGPSDEEIRSLIIERSVASYSGSCPCPYNIDRGGRRCGGRSAYSRPGGASPVCYPSDITDAEVIGFRGLQN